MPDVPSRPSLTHELSCQEETRQSLHEAGNERIGVRRWWLCNGALLVALVIALDGLGFGLFQDKLSFNTPLGAFGILHLYTAALVVVSVVWGRWLIPTLSNALVLPLVLLVLLFLVELATGLVRGLMQVPPSSAASLIRNAVQYFQYLFFFVVVLLVRSRAQLRSLVRAIFFLGMVSGFLAIYQYISGREMAASQLRYWAGYQRFLLPTTELLICTYYTTLAFWMLGSGRRWILGAATLVPLVALAVTLHRNVLVSLSIVSSALIVYVLRRRASAMWKPVLLGLLGMGALAGLGVRFQVLGTRVASAVSDLTQMRGNAWHRIALITNAWRDVLSNYPILGRGFDWLPFPEYETYLRTAIVYSPTNDSGIASVLMVFGLAGLLLLVFVFWRIFRGGSQCLRLARTPFEQALIIGILAFQADTLVRSPFTDVFSGQPGTAVLACSWGILYILFTMQATRASR